MTPLQNMPFGKGHIKSTMKYVHLFILTSLIGGAYNYSLTPENAPAKPLQNDQSKPQIHNQSSENNSHLEETSSSSNDDDFSETHLDHTILRSSREELDQLNETEQTSLWTAFFEARRGIYSIADNRSEREENIGYDFYSVHPKQKLTTRFGSDGVQIVSSQRTHNTAWSATIKTLSLAGQKISPKSPAQITTEGTNLIEYQHTDHLTEWYHSGSDVMEHGYTISQRPTHLNQKETIIINVALEGLTAKKYRTEEGSFQINFLNDKCKILRYSKLLVIDAHGQEMTASMSPENSGFNIAYHDLNATYPITVTVTIEHEGANLVTNDASAFDFFGTSVAISGNSVVVGAHGDDDDGTQSGSAYVFTCVDNTWSMQAKLTANDAAAGDMFGESVAISGNSIVVGARFDNDSGSAYVFHHCGSTWTQQAKLTANDAGADDMFGESVAISGNSIVVGSCLDDDAGMNSGSAYIFHRSDNSWSQQAKLIANDATANGTFGRSVAISGNSVVIGAAGNRTKSGKAYIFNRSGNTWIQQAKLTANDASGFEQFGFSVDISGNSVVVGAPSDDDHGRNSGSAYVFTRSNNMWSMQTKLTANDAAVNDLFGNSVAISGGSIVIGARLNDGQELSIGSVYVFNRTGTTWSQQNKLTANDASASDNFGISVAISGNFIIAGANGNDDTGESSGSTYLFTHSDNSWIQHVKLTANNTPKSENHGISITTSGNFVVVETAEDDGAYVFTRKGNTWLQQAKLTANDSSITLPIPRPPLLISTQKKRAKLYQPNAFPLQ